MNTDFLFKEYLGLSLYNYIIAAVLIIFALFLKRYLSSILAKTVFKFLGKYSDAKYLHLFQDLVLHPFQGLVVTNFLYIAVQHLSPLIDNVIIFSRPATTNKEKLIVTLIDVVDVVFFFFEIFYVMLLVSRILDFIFKILVDSFIEKGDKVKQQIFPLLKDILKVLLWSIGAFLVLKLVFEVDITALVAGMGIGGIAIAFALKESLENLLASFLIMLDKPFVIGDWIIVNGVEGTIEKLGFRSTIIRTFDRTLISVPNKKLIEDNLENFTESGIRRVKFELGMTYGVSEEAMKTVTQQIKEAIQEHPNLMDDCQVWLDNFGDFSVNFVVYYYVQMVEGISFFEVKQDINYKIYSIMYRYAKGFPFPTATYITGTELNEVGE